MSIFQNAFNGVRIFFRDFKAFFRNRKIRIFYIAMLLLSCLGLSSSSLIASAFFPNNQAITLHEISEDYKKENNSFPNGLIYYHSLITNSNNPMFRDSMTTKGLREVFYKNEFIDVYVSNWINKFTPGVVKYDGENETPLSFLMLPRQGYTDTQWQDKYKIPLLSPSQLGHLSSPNDIFINKEYADYLISKKPVGEQTYEHLINNETIIPYTWKYSEKSSPDYVDNKYIIKGVLDSESEEYLKYKELFGDFFVLNEYFSLPFMGQTFFSINSSETSINLFSKLLKEYEYKYIKFNYSSNSSSFAFQTRISFFDSKDGNYSINKIDYNPHKYCVRTDSCFEVFSNQMYIIYIVLLLMINVAFAIIFAFFSLKFQKEKDDNKKITTIKMFVYIGLIGLGLLFGILISKLFFIGIIPLKYLSSKNYLGTIIYAVEILTGLIVFCLSKLIKKKIEFKI